MTMRRLMTWLFGAFLLLLREDAFALGLLDGYHLALENDPQFQAAIQEHEAGRQYRALGRAALLPRLVYSYNRGRSWSDVTQTTTRGDFKEDRDYDSYVSTLSLQQPLFDYEAFSRYRKGVAQALLSDERFRSQSQELLVRVLEAYTGALLAQDQIELARAQKRSYREQFRSTSVSSSAATAPAPTPWRPRPASTWPRPRKSRRGTARMPPCASWSGWSGRRWRSPTWRRSANASRCAR